MTETESKGAFALHYDVNQLNDSNESEWNALNEQSPEGSFYVSTRWLHALDHSPLHAQDEPKHFLVFRDGEAVAICPAHHRRWKAKGLVTLCTLEPLYDDMTVIVKYPDDHQIAREIISECRRVLRKDPRSGLPYAKLAFYQGTANCFRDAEVHPHLLPGSAAGDMILDLGETSTERLWNSFAKNDRRKLLLPERDGWSVEQANSESDVEEFYKFFQANLQHIGFRTSTVPSIGFFRQLMKAFNSREMLVYLLRKEETVAGGLVVFLFEFKKTMYWKYAALNRQVPNRYSPLLTLLWHMVKEASSLGYTRISFGGTSANPADIHHRIKAKFGCRFQPRYEVTFPKHTRAMRSFLSAITSVGT